MSPSSENDSRRPKPSPGYFIVRTTGEVVPLIAVDELPRGTDLLGVPRSLDLEGTIGMLNLGLQRSSGSFYQIRGSRQKDGSINGDTHVSNAPELITQPAPQSVPEPRQPKAPQTTRTGVINNTVPRPTSHALPQPTIPRLEAQVCRHWCTHGICKWGQQCHFRHIMPMTLSGLRAVGLHDWPAWYRALNLGYFAGTAEKRRAKAGACAGDRCCAATASNAVLVQNSVQELRSKGQTDAGAQIEEREDIAIHEEVGGQQTLARSRTMQRTGAGKAGLGKTDHVSKNIMPERAAVKDTKDWEDERGSDVGLDTVEKKGGVSKEKLVDV